MKKKQVLAFALLALLWFATVGQTLGQTRTAGVHEDDKFTYTITAFWSSVNASATVPDDLVGINGTLYYRVAVSTILASNVTTQDTWHYSNGTESTAIVVQDVDSGSSYVMKGLVNVVGSNLGPGDLLYPTGNDPRRINQTISVDYGSSKRDASAVVYDFPTLDSLNNVVGYEKSAFYFDKATGMLVARSDFTSNAAENVSIVILLANTNLWSITKSPSITSSSSTPSASSSTPTPDSVQVF
ncbi:MAG TPA: hypothetical protein VJ066_02610, partial [Candidatus Bathyarchaeia archaeon]|nr:hypothetical protein [Candidatus Bathyarchaeia archaeon]